MSFVLSHWLNINIYLSILKKNPSNLFPKFLFVYQMLWLQGFDLHRTICISWSALERTGVFFFSLVFIPYPNIAHSNPFRINSTREARIMFQHYKHFVCLFVCLTSGFFFRSRTLLRLNFLTVGFIYPKMYTQTWIKPRRWKLFLGWTPSRKVFFSSLSLPPPPGRSECNCQ